MKSLNLYVTRMCTILPSEESPTHLISALGEARDELDGLHVAPLEGAAVPPVPEVDSAVGEDIMLKDHDLRSFYK